MAKFTKNYQKSSTPPNSFSIEVTKPTGEKIIKHNCTLYNGVVVVLSPVGRGKKTEKAYWSPEGDADVVEEWEYYAYIPLPIFLVQGQPESVIKEIHKINDECAKKQDFTECFNRFRQYMPIMGANPKGYFVRNLKEVEEEKIKQNRKITLYAGFRGLKMLERVPGEMWAKIKGFATFYKKEDIEEYYEDTDDFGRVDNARDESGWNYGTAVIAVLLANGYELTYRSNPVLKLEDIEEIDTRLAKEEQEREERVRQRRVVAESLRQRFNELTKWEYMDKADTEPVAKLPSFTAKLLKWEGSHLYGVGHWGKRDENYLYKIDQNGHDGDDWSRNNSREGIVWRTPMTPELRALLTEIETFEK